MHYVRIDNIIRANTAQVYYICKQLRDVCVCKFHNNIVIFCVAYNVHHANRCVDGTDVLDILLFLLLLCVFFFLLLSWLSFYRLFYINNRSNIDKMMLKKYEYINCTIFTALSLWTLWRWTRWVATQTLAPHTTYVLHCFFYTSLAMVKWFVVIYVKLLSHHHIWEITLHTNKKHKRPILYSNMCWN